MKKISILGSTGSIGRQTLEVVDQLKNIQVIGLAGNNNIKLLEEQVRKYNPKVVAVYDEKNALAFKENISDLNVKVVSGMEGLIQVSIIEEIDTVVTSVVGMIGLIPTVEAIKHKKDIALANKETLVTAGEIIMPLAKENNVKILPVDSEHSAIFQCLQGGKNPSKLIITASGGPFRGKTKNDLRKVTLADALKHPNWSMGKKITVDSSTLMNKGLEVIEAKWLFDMAIEDIDVVVHPQSIIHSMVEFADGSILGQMGLPDMRLPIQYALTYPERVTNTFDRLDFTKLTQLTFEKPDIDTFICLKFAFEAIKVGGTMPTVLNAANEEAVALFLEEKIKYYEIAELIEATMQQHKIIQKPNLQDILDTEKWARRKIKDQRK